MTDVYQGFAIIPNRTKVLIIYPTVKPEVVVVPIITSIVLFPIVALIIICCLRKRAARARQKARLQKREDPYLSERSCASVARLSPPLSAGLHRPPSRTDFEMTTTTVELVTPDS